jgi:hypothetical protein
MPCIEILSTGHLDKRDSAFPQAVQLPDGDILCSFSVGGGPKAQGGTDCARSTDGGETWMLQGTILQSTKEPYTTNALKLTLSNDGRTIYAYGLRSYGKPKETFGEGRNEPILCCSTDGGRTWSSPEVIPMPGDCPLEISHGITALSSGRLLAPAATLPSKDRLGEQVLVAISDDGGQTWPTHAVVFKDPEKKFGYFEQKLTEVAPGRVMAVCWTVTLGDVVDQHNSFTISNDNGCRWAEARSTGIRGQTMTPISLGGNQLLVLYNRRYGHQGIVMSLVTFTEEGWAIHYEGIMYDAKRKRERPENLDTGVQEFKTFQFGFPTAIRLQDNTYLATHWCREEEAFGIRWTKLRIDW